MNWFKFYITETLTEIYSTSEIAAIARIGALTALHERDPGEAAIKRKINYKTYDKLQETLESQGMSIQIVVNRVLKDIQPYINRRKSSTKNNHKVRHNKTYEENFQESECMCREDKIKEKDIKEDSSLNIPFNLKVEFNKLWSVYPLKVGQTAAFELFSQTVKTEKELKNIQIALNNYRQHLKHNEWKSPQNASTWFARWHDWLAGNYIIFTTKEKNEELKKLKEKMQDLRNTESTDMLLLADLIRTNPDQEDELLKRDEEIKLERENELYKIWERIEVLENEMETGSDNIN